MSARTTTKTNGLVIPELTVKVPKAKAKTKKAAPATEPTEDELARTMAEAAEAAINDAALAGSPEPTEDEVARASVEAAEAMINDSAIPAPAEPAPKTRNPLLPEPGTPIGPAVFRQKSYYAVELADGHGFAVTDTCHEDGTPDFSMADSFDNLTKARNEIVRDTYEQGLGRELTDQEWERVYYGQAPTMDFWGLRTPANIRLLDTYLPAPGTYIHSTDYRGRHAVARECIDGTWECWLGGLEEEKRHFGNFKTLAVAMNFFCEVVAAHDKGEELTADEKEKVRVSLPSAKVFWGFQAAPAPARMTHEEAEAKIEKLRPRMLEYRKAYYDLVDKIDALTKSIEETPENRSLPRLCQSLNHFSS